MTTAETRTAIIEMGPYTLDVTFDASADLDGAFKAVCNDTGETLSINGWLIESIDYTDGEEA
mgnify:CR=1 FL=1